MTLEQEKSKELPDYLFVVVTDVDRRSSIPTAKTIRSIAPTPNWNVQRVKNYGELFDIGLHGNVIGGSELIVLEDDYTSEWEDWVFSETKRGDQLVNQLMRRGMEEEEAHWFVSPKALTFAAALRLFGYDGKIIVASGVAPDEEKIRQVERDLGNILLLDGISVKSRSMNPLSGIYRKKTSSGVELEDMLESGRFEDSLRWLLPRVLG